MNNWREKEKTIVILLNIINPLKKTQLKNHIPEYIKNNMKTLILAMISFTLKGYTQ